MRTSRERVRHLGPHYRRLTVRTLNPEADLFYRALDFRTEPPVPSATHHLDL